MKPYFAILCVLWSVLSGTLGEVENVPDNGKLQSLDSTYYPLAVQWKRYQKAGQFDQTKITKTKLPSSQSSIRFCSQYLVCIRRVCTSLSLSTEHLGDTWDVNPLLPRSAEGLRVYVRSSGVKQSKICIRCHMTSMASKRLTLEPSLDE